MSARLGKLGKGGHYFAVFYDGKRTPKEKSVPLGTRMKSAALKKFTRWVDDYEYGRRDPWSAEKTTGAVTLRQACKASLSSRSHLRPKSQTA